MIFMSYELQYRYLKSQLITVSDKTYSINDIPFPAITICNGNRINYKKVRAAAEIFYPEALNDTYKYENFELLLRGLDQLEYTYTRLDLKSYKRENLSDLSKINLLELLEFVSIKCADFINKCFWQGAFQSCCDIFKMQRTPYGLCFAFNSLLVPSVKKNSVSNNSTEF